MEIDFEKMPRFKEKTLMIFSLIPQWAFANQVDNDAIIRQLYIAHAWCDSNPRKAPKKDPVRFLWSWMRLAKKHGNLVPRPKVAPKPAEKENYDMTIEEMREIRMRNMAGMRHV